MCGVTEVSYYTILFVDEMNHTLLQAIFVAIILLCLVLILLITILKKLNHSKFLHDPFNFCNTTLCNTCTTKFNYNIENVVLN